MGEFEKHLVDELVGADRAAYRRQFGVRWVAADEVVFVKALELVVTWMAASIRSSISSSIASEWSTPLKE
jgi:hypothetical protein